MSALDQLQKQAESACNNRGHQLGKWEIYHGERNSLANNACVRCGKEVQCNTLPLPNGIDIGGEALALGCRD